MKLTSCCRLFIIICLALSLVLVQPANMSHAQDEQGFVLGWGDNSFGELGDNTTNTRLILTQADGMTNITQIATGESFALALASDGTVWAWGQNNYGQLGNGTTTDQHVPSQIRGLTNVKQLEQAITTA